MKRSLWLGMVFTFGLISVNQAAAGWIIDKYGSETPEESWAYSKVVGVGEQNSIWYEPLKEDWTGAIFQGYVRSGSNGDWNTTWVGPYDEDTIHIFKTFIQSEEDMTLSISFSGDDGHSLYIDDMLVNSGPYGVSANLQLSLLAGKAVKVEIGDYNGPGPMGVEFSLQGSRSRIEDVPGIRINAEGQFSAVPEPASLTLLGIGAVALVGHARRRRQQFRLPS